MSLIAFSGKIGSGKDTVTEMLQKLAKEQYHTKFTNAKFATKLKDFAANITGIPRDWFDDPIKKNSILGPEWNIDEKQMTLRDIMIRIGHGMRVQVHPDIWVNALFSEYKEQYEPFHYSELLEDHDFVPKRVMPDWIISDMRYPNELNRVKLLNGISVRIKRDGVAQIDHESETSLDNAEFDYYIDNNGTLQNLEEQVRELFKTITKNI